MSSMRTQCSHEAPFGPTHTPGLSQCPLRSDDAPIGLSCSCGPSQGPPSADTRPRPGDHDAPSDAMPLRSDRRRRSDAMPPRFDTTPIRFGTTPKHICLTRSPTGCPLWYDKRLLSVWHDAPYKRPVVGLTPCGLTWAAMSDMCPRCLTPSSHGSGTKPPSVPREAPVV